MATPTTQFDQFFPGWNSRIQQILSEKCANELAFYKTGQRSPSDPLSALINPVIECILSEFPEYRKVELAISAVLLGLAPTIFQMLGSTTGEMALLSLRRPFLAFLLGVGSPTASPMRAFTYDDPIALLDAATTTATPYRSSSFAPKAVAPSLWRLRGGSWQARLVSLCQYLVVAACVGNVVQLSYELTVHAIVMIAPSTIFAVPLWASTAVLLHVAGAFALRMRVRVRKLDDPRRRELQQQQWHHQHHHLDQHQHQHQQHQEEGQHYTTTTTHHHSRAGFLPLLHLPAWLRDELTPSAHHGPTRLEYRGESVFLIVLMWTASVGTVIHMLWGTLVLSSLLFFSIADSAQVVGRFCVSVLVCRVVLMYELAGMKAASRRVGEVVGVVGGDAGHAGGGRGGGDGGDDASPFMKGERASTVAVADMAPRVISGSGGRGGGGGGPDVIELSPRRAGVADLRYNYSRVRSV